MNKTGPALNVGKQAGAGMLTERERARVGKKDPKRYPTCPRMEDKEYIKYLQAENTMLKRRIREMGGEI